MMLHELDRAMAAKVFVKLVKKIIKKNSRESQPSIEPLIRLMGKKPFLLNTCFFIVKTLNLGKNHALR